MIRRALVRVLVVVGLVHVLDAVVLALLWRHRVAVVRALAAAAGEEMTRRRDATEGSPATPCARPGCGHRRGQHSGAGRCVAWDNWPADCACQTFVWPE